MREVTDWLNETRFQQTAMRLSQDQDYCEMAATAGQVVVPNRWKYYEFIEI